MKRSSTLTLAPAALPAPSRQDRLVRAGLALLLLGSLWALWLQYAAPAEAPWAMPAAVSAILCLASAFLPEKGWAPWARMGTLALLLLAALVGRSDVSAGLTLCRNAWRAGRTAASGVLHPALEAAGTGSGLVFYLVLGGAMALLCRAIAEKAPCLGAAGCLGGSLAVLLLQETAGAPWAAAALLGTGVLLLVSGTGTGRDRLLPGLAALLAVFLAAGAVLIIPSARSGALFSAWRADSKQALHAFRYETGADPLPEGDLSNITPRTETGRVMLTVTLDQPEPLYFRGFAGEIYTGTGWASPTGADLAREGETLWWLHDQDFYPAHQMALAARAAGAAAATAAFTVTNQAACTAYAYLPVSAAADSLIRNPLRLLAEEGCRETISGTLIPGGAEQGAAWLAALQEENDPAAAVFLEEESAYRTLVENDALEVPEDLRALLLPRLREAGWTDDSTSGESIAAVRRFLEESFSYSDGGLTLEAGSDLIETLLARGTGSDVHYASLAVMALRCCGIPARYAEGYVLTAQDASQAGEGGIPLRDGSAHAWAEVYQPGLGWLPLELTPGYAAQMGTAGQAGGLAGMVPGEDGEAIGGSGTGETKEGEEYEPEPDQNADTSPDPGEVPDDGTHSQTRLRRDQILRMLCAVLLALALLCAAVWLRRRRILRTRQAIFDGEDLSPALAARFAHCVRLLEELGFDRAGGSLYALAPALDGRFGPDYASRFRRMTAVQQEAVFSSHPLSPELRGEMAGFDRETTALLQKNAGFWAKLRQKWLKCLY